MAIGELRTSPFDVEVHTVAPQKTIDGATSGVELAR